jgi:putative phage-type endonuclease
MTAVELLPPGTGPHDERWHELRRAGVTASEIAVVMGISPYESPFSLYWQKVNDWRWGGNEYTSVGSHLEDAIADWWMAGRDPLENLQAQWAGLYAHSDRPWQLATPDRLLYLSCAACGGRGLYGPDDPDYTLACRECDLAGYVGEPIALLECKWVAQSWDDWGEEGTDDIPVYYRAQGLWQADVMGVDTVYFPVLGPTGFRSYVVHRDERAEEDLRVMRGYALDFVRRLNENDPPDLDSHSATTGALKKLHPSLGEGDVEVPVELAERYRVARADRKAADERVDQCENEIRAALGSDFNRAVVGKKLVASRSIYEQSGDSAELTALEGDWPVVDRLNPGRAESYA